MKIGIIGAGNIGSVLALRWVEHGHEVLIGNSRGPDTLADVARETGAKPAELADVVRGAAVIVVTIPEKKVLDLPAGLFDDVPETTVVIDTGNYYPRERDGRIDGIESDDGKRVGRAADRPAGYQGVQQHLRGSFAQSRQARRHAGADCAASLGR